jgi:hypothetical protein
MTTSSTAGSRPEPSIRPGPLGSWAELHQEPCRAGHTYWLLVNHRTQAAIELTAAEAGICHQLSASGHPGDTGPARSFLQELREQGFLASDPPPAKAGRRLTVSVSALDVRWSGADRLVRAAHDRGVRHLFRPAAVAAQIMLALAGVVALAAAIFSRQAFQLRVHPAQIPIVIGLSMAAVAVHEFAHALVVVHHRRRVDAAGVRLHLGVPAFYVEAAGALLLTRRQRLVQAAAGAWAEWLFTAAAAIFLWLAPFPAAVPLLHRFVILNAATIASNLAPFVGLDGYWLLADGIRLPDLAGRARGSVSRLATALAGKAAVPAGEWLLAGYSSLNGIVAAALLATAGFFWYQLFGGLAGALARHGPAGWLALAAAAAILARPAITAAAPRLAAAARAAQALRQAITFRLQWRWRVPATRRLAATIPQLAALNGHELGVLAGHLQRTRARRADLRHTTGYGMVYAGALTAITGTGAPVTLTAGATWDPRHQLHRAISRRTILISTGTAAIEHLLTDTPA